MTARRPSTNAPPYSPIDNEAPLRVWRALRIVPQGELGTGRRAVILALVAWLPLALWAVHAGRFLSSGAGEPLMQHYGIHVRCLIAIPLLVLAEATLHRAGITIAERFVASGAVPPALQPRYEATLRDAIRLRDATLPWAIAFGVALAWSLADAPDPREDALSWAADGDGTLRFGGWWFAYVARPIFVALLLGWLWRIALVSLWIWKVGRLGLSYVPSHPDRMGGIAFVAKLPGAFAPVTLALAAVLASRWAHDVVHHGAALASFRMPALGFAALWTLLLLAPLFAMAPALRAAKRAALPAYAALVGEQGRLVHQRWIERRPVDDERIEPAGVGPLADAASLFEAVARMRSVPLDNSALAGILVPMAVPFVLLAAVQFPLKDLLIKLVKVLV